MAQIQIDKNLFLDLCKYHLAGLKDPEREQRIITALQAKIDKSVARERYMENRTITKSF